MQKKLNLVFLLVIIPLLDHFFIRIIKVILAEKKKTKKIKAILIGFYHFLINKSGFYEVK